MAEVVAAHKRALQGVHSVPSLQYPSELAFWRPATCAHSFSRSRRGCKGGSLRVTQRSHPAQRKRAMRLESSAPSYAGSTSGRTLSSGPKLRPQGTLTLEQLDFYHSQGYLVLPGFVSPDHCQQLRQRAVQLVDEFCTPDTVSVFSTRSQVQKTDRYFMDSAASISFFFEEKAFGDGGELQQTKELSINKIGHALHDLDPAFRSLSRSDELAALMASLGYRSPLPVQSMYIFKQPGIGGEVVPHQDNSFLYTDPPSTVGFWVALEDATRDNGCLWALPGSHKDGLRRRFRKLDGGGVSFDSPPPEYDLDVFIPLEVAAGTVVLLHGDLVHMSYENRSPKSRHAYTVHLVEGDATTWASDNWLQRPSDAPFEPLYINHS